MRGPVLILVFIALCGGPAPVSAQPPSPSFAVHEDLLPLPLFGLGRMAALLPDWFRTSPDFTFDTPSGGTVRFAVTSPGVGSTVKGRIAALQESLPSGDDGASGPVTLKGVATSTGDPVTHLAWETSESRAAAYLFPVCADGTSVEIRFEEPLADVLNAEPARDASVEVTDWDPVAAAVRPCLDDLSTWAVDSDKAERVEELIKGWVYAQRSVVMEMRAVADDENRSFPSVYARMLELWGGSAAADDYLRSQIAALYPDGVRDVAPWVIAHSVLDPGDSMAPAVALIRYAHQAPFMQHRVDDIEDQLRQAEAATNEALRVLGMSPIEPQSSDPDAGAPDPTPYESLAP